MARSRQEYGLEPAIGPSQNGQSPRGRTTAMAPTSRKSGRPGQAMFILVALPMISYFLYANVLNEYQQVLVRKHLSDVPALLAQIAFGALKAVMDLVQSSAVGHAAKPFSSDACDFARRGLAENILAQPTAVELLSTAVCDHIKSRVPRKPLVVSAHGPPGVGKSLTHRTLALTLWNVAMEDMAHCPGSACPGYFTIFGVDYTERDKREQWERIRRSVVGHLRSNPEALVVIEEYDRLDCEARGFLRQLLDHGTLLEEGINAARSIFILESNAATLEISKLTAQGSLGDGSVESVIKDVLFEIWRRDDSCFRDEEDRNMINSRTISRVDFYLPYAPLTKSDIRDVIESYLTHIYKPQWEEQEKALGAKLTWDDSIVSYLADRIEYVDGPGDIKFSVEGAAPVHNIVTMTLSVHLNRRKDEGALDLGSVVTLSVAKGSVTSQISSPAVGATRH